MIILNDWSKNSLQSEIAKYFHVGKIGSYDSMLINGRGVQTNSSGSSSGMSGMGMKNLILEKMDNMQTDKDPNAQTPLSIFKVKQGFRYRFRVIDAGLEFCPMQFSIDKHNLTLIATDGNPIEPVEVESFVLTPGERFDFILNARQDVDDYWIKVRGEGECLGKQIYQRAILSYEDSMPMKMDMNMNMNKLNVSAPFTYDNAYRFGMVSYFSNIYCRF